MITGGSFALSMVRFRPTGRDIGKRSGAYGDRRQTRTGAHCRPMSPFCSFCSLYRRDGLRHGAKSRRAAEREGATISRVD
jgi:hypothetical protein